MNKMFLVNNFFIQDLKQTKYRFSLCFVYFIMLSPFFSALLSTLGLVIGVNPLYFGLNIIPIIYPAFWIVFLGLDFSYLLLSKRNPLKKQNWIYFAELGLLLLMIVWAFIACFFHPASTNSFWFIKNTEIQNGAYYFIGLALCFVCGFLINNKRTLFHLSIAFIISMLFCSLLSIIFPQGNMYLLLGRNTPWASMFVNSNHFAYLLCVAIILSAGLFLTTTNKKSQIFFGSAGFVFMFVIILNDTLGSILPTLLLLITYPIVLSIKDKKFSWKFIIPLAVFIVLSVALIPLSKVYYSTYSESSLWAQLFNMNKEIVSIAKDPLAQENLSAGTLRWEKWLDSLDQISQNPIFGNGEIDPKPHNVFLQIAENYGIPALLFYLGAIGFLTIKALRYFKHLSALSLVLWLSMITYWISSFFGNYLINTSPFYVVLLALTISCINHDITLAKDNSSTPQTAVPKE